MGLCITPRNLFCMLLVPKKRAMEPQSRDEYNGRDAAEARGNIATWRLRRPPKRRTLGLKFWTRRTGQPDAQERNTESNKGGNHADQAWPHLFAFACCVAGHGGDDRLRPGHGAGELTAQSLSLRGGLGQAAGRAHLGLDVGG